eukprot:GHVT01069684.1.p1 GENE.GHVT01069684.1~~GHVT01069684.1.p1  ORF type:complete len:954 (-),score=185.22 GHVT01069684.1:329-3190(-)
MVVTRWPLPQEAESTSGPPFLQAAGLPKPCVFGVHGVQSMHDGRTRCRPSIPWRHRYRGASVGSFWTVCRDQEAPWMHIRPSSTSAAFPAANQSFAAVRVAGARSPPLGNELNEVAATGLHRGVTASPAAPMPVLATVEPVAADNLTIRVSAEATVVAVAHGGVGSHKATKDGETPRKRRPTTSDICSPGRPTRLHHSADRHRTGSLRNLHSDLGRNPGAAQNGGDQLPSLMRGCSPQSFPEPLLPQNSVPPSGETPPCVFSTPPQSVSPAVPTCSTFGLAVSQTEGDERARASETQAEPTEASFVGSLALVLQHLVSVSSASAHDEEVTRFHAIKEPEISIKEYLKRVATYFDCSNECFVLALVYIDRIMKLHERFTVSILNIHRLLITAVTLAAKFFDDTYYSNRHYARVGGVRTKEINALEAHFLSLIQFQLYVSAEEYDQYRVNVIAAVQQATLQQHADLGQNLHSVSGAPGNDKSLCHSDRPAEHHAAPLESSRPSQTDQESQFETQPSASSPGRGVELQGLRPPTAYAPVTPCGDWAEACAAFSEGSTSTPEQDRGPTGRHGASLPADKAWPSLSNKTSLGKHLVDLTDVTSTECGEAFDSTDRDETEEEECEARALRRQGEKARHDQFDMAWAAPADHAAATRPASLQGAIRPAGSSMGMPVGNPPNGMGEPVSCPCEKPRDLGEWVAPAALMQPAVIASNVGADAVWAGSSTHQGRRRGGFCEPSMSVVSPLRIDEQCSGIASRSRTSPYALSASPSVSSWRPKASGMSPVEMSSQTLGGSVHRVGSAAVPAAGIFAPSGSFSDSGLASVRPRFPWVPVWAQDESLTGSCPSVPQRSPQLEQQLSSKRTHRLPHLCGVDSVAPPGEEYHRPPGRLLSASSRKLCGISVSPMESPRYVAFSSRSLPCGVDICAERSPSTPTVALDPILIFADADDTTVERRPTIQA